MTIKILQLCLVLGSSFKELVKFSLSNAAQLLKLRLRTKPTLRNILTVTVCQYNVRIITYIILTRNLTHYPKYQIYTLN